jgi:hypothetical protein
MKHACTSGTAVFLLLAFTALAGCAPGQGTMRGPNPQVGASGHAGHHAAGPGPIPDMCRHYHDMATADPEARRAMMEKHMQDMPAEQRERHMRMMRDRCRQDAGATSPDRP